METLKVMGKDVDIYDISIGKKSGYGQYRIVAQCNVNGEKKDFCYHSTNSVLYDEKSNDEITPEYYKQMLLSNG